MPAFHSPLRRALLLAIPAGLLPRPVLAAEVSPLMLSKPWDGRQSLVGVWVSEKYDGVRGYWDGRQLRTRAGNPIAAPAWFTAGWPATPLDGELWAGRGRFAQALSTVRDQTPDDTAWRVLRYMVFDLPAHAGRFDERLPALQSAVQQIAQPWVQAVEQNPATDAAALQRQLDAVVREGGEGLMLHRGQAHYTAQRSDALCKLKPFEDAEARVVGHVAGQGKHAGRLGALWLELPAQGGQPVQRFKLGTGFSDAERAAPPAVGSWVSYRYQGSTARGLPRFASFLRAAPGPGW